MGRIVEAKEGSAVRRVADSARVTPQRTLHAEQMIKKGGEKEKMHVTLTGAKGAGKLAPLTCIAALQVWKDEELLFAGERLSTSL